MGLEHFPRPRLQRGRPPSLPPIVPQQNFAKQKKISLAYFFSFKRFHSGLDSKKPMAIEESPGAILSRFPSYSGNSDLISEAEWIDLEWETNIREYEGKQRGSKRPEENRNFFFLILHFAFHIRRGKSNRIAPHLAIWLQGQKFYANLERSGLFLATTWWRRGDFESVASCPPRNGQQWPTRAKYGQRWPSIAKSYWERPQ